MCSFGYHCHEPNLCGILTVCNRVRFPLRWRGVQLLHKGQEGEEVWHPPGVLLPEGGSAAQPTEDVLSSPDLGWSLGVSRDLFLCMYLLKSEAGRTMEISFLDGTEMTWWPSWRKSTQRGRTKEQSGASSWTSPKVYTGHVRLTFFVFFCFVFLF